MTIRGRVRAEKGVVRTPVYNINLHKAVERPFHANVRPFGSDGPSARSSNPYGLIVGGYSNDNSENAPNYGLSYMDANNDVGNSNTNVGGRLASVLISAYNAITVILAAAGAWDAGPLMGLAQYAGEKTAILHAGLVPKGNVRSEDKGPGAMQ